MLPKFAVLTATNGLAVPGRPFRSLVAEDRSAAGVRDQRGPEASGRRWLRGASRWGVRRAPEATTVSDETTAL